MVPVEALWRPILLSALFVFVASNIMWMALPFWHAKDYKKLKREGEVLKAMADEAAGQYVVPCVDWKNATPEEKTAAQCGPMGFLILRGAGGFSFPQALAAYVAYTVLMTAIVAYLCGLALPAGAHYSQVFRVVGTAGMLAFSFGDIPNAIWYGKPWGAVLKSVIDGLIYGLLMGGTFGWLWPK
ncbi:MAG: hypothetical protein IPL96_10145 [Holophagaceae bacterium]|nr:hypothetical protein [Holophagaceae bacterium]